MNHTGGNRSEKLSSVYTATDGGGVDSKNRSENRDENLTSQTNELSGAAAADIESRAPLSPHREYQWDKWIPENVPEYIPSGGEYEEIAATINSRHEMDAPARIRLTGPTGSGKTHLPRYLAQEQGAPLIDISVKWAIDSTDLLGRYVYVNDETRWINGPLTKAILASQEQDVYLLLDEVNRARPEAKSALFEALDDRTQVTIDALGGEIISGCAENIILFSTMNTGKGHYTEEMDLAEKRRLGAVWELDYLGLETPKQEVDLLVTRTDCSRAFAEASVQFANSIRETAQESDTDIQRGVATGVLIEFVRLAIKYAASDLSNPVVRAGMSQIVRPLYHTAGRDQSGKETVVELLNSYFNGCPVEAVLYGDEFDRWVGNDVEDTLDVETDHG